MLQENQNISYNHNGNIYSGTIVAIYENGAMTVIEHDNSAAWILWNMGFAVGTYIYPSQVIA